MIIQIENQYGAENPPATRLGDAESSEGRILVVAVINVSDGAARVNK
jgi:hypothetical protein